MKVGDIVQVYEDPITEHHDWFRCRLVLEDWSQDKLVGFHDRRQCRRWFVAPIRCGGDDRKLRQFGESDTTQMSFLILDDIRTPVILWEFGCWVMVDEMVLVSQPLEISETRPKSRSAKAKRFKHDGWIEVTEPDSQVYLDRVNDLFGSSYVMADFGMEDK